MRSRIEMSILHRNLEALRSRDAALAERIDRCPPGETVQVISARSGAVTIQVEGRLEASSEDPEQEAEQLAAHFLERAREAGATRLGLFGLGVHTLRCLEPFDGDLLVIEPSLELCRAVLERVDLSRALARFELIVTRQPAPALRHPLFRSRERGLFLAHGAARRREPKLHDDLAQRFHPGGTPSSLDVAVIPPLYGGSLPVAQGCARALRSLGHHVRETDLTPFWPGYQLIRNRTADPRLQSASDSLRSALVRVIGEMLLATFQLDPPDLVFAVAQAPLDPWVLNQMGRMGIARAFWFCEDFRVMPYWKELARCYDTIFHVQPDDFAGPLREAGGTGVPLPMAFDPSAIHPVALSEEEQRRFGSDVSFVGAGYHNRRQLLPGLLDLGLRIYGVEWPPGPPFETAMPEPNQRQSPEDSNRIFNATRINLNLHSSPWCDGVNPVGDYLNPRTFELAGARAFQLVDERRELARAFRPGLEVETYADLAECRRKIRHYLRHEDERREIAENAHRRALAEHTFRHRMEEAVDYLRAGPAPLAPRRSDLPTVAAVLESARDEPGLAEVLRRARPEAVVDADLITAAVAGGKGPLTRDEKLLLYMREVLGELHFLARAGYSA